MRKIILLSMIAFSALSYAQSLVVTPLGLRDANDNEKTFVVINAEGKTAKELYYDAIKYINRNYKSPNDVIKGKIEGEYLRFISHASSIISVKFYPKKFPKQRAIRYPLDCTVELNFKDGKVKYEITNWKADADGLFELQLIENQGLLMVINPGIYSKKGEVVNDIAKYQIETYFNSQIKALSEELNGKSNNDNW